MKAQYKREAANCETAARENQQEADRLITEAGQKMDEARELDDRARSLENEAIRWRHLSVRNIRFQCSYYRLDRQNYQ